MLQTLASQLRILLSTPKGNDIYVFWQYANKMKHGLMPYIGFHPEYPPLAFLFIYFPYFFTKDPLFYEFLFGVEVFIAVCVGVYILWQWEKNSEKIWIFLLLLMIMQASEYRLVFGRFDIFAAVLTMIALFLFLKKHNEAYGWFFLFLGVMTKLYPIVLIPLLFYKAKKKWLCLWFIIPFLVSNISLFFITHGHYIDFLGKQAHRPVELESIESGIILGLYVVGNIPLKLVPDLGGVGIFLPSIVHSILQLFIVILLLFPIVLHRKSILQYNSMRLVVILLVFFIIYNPTFSPQFLIWIIPFVPFLTLPEIIVMLIITGLTSWFFSFWINLTHWLALLIVVRNIMFILFYFILISEGKRTMVHVAGNKKK